MTKFRGRFLNRNNFATVRAQRNDTNVWRAKITGITANSPSLSAVSWEASFVKTACVRHKSACFCIELYVLRHGVNSMTLRLAANFCISALNMPWRATMYPGKLTHTTSRTASNTRSIRWPKGG